MAYVAIAPVVTSRTSTCRAACLLVPTRTGPYGCLLNGRSPTSIVLDHCFLPWRCISQFLLGSASYDMNVMFWCVFAVGGYSRQLLGTPVPFSHCTTVAPLVDVCAGTANCQIHCSRSAAITPNSCAVCGPRAAEMPSLLRTNKGRSNIRASTDLMFMYARLGL